MSVRSCLVLAGSLWCAAACPAALATFDDLAEGFHGNSFTTGGITFFEPVHFFGEAAPFAVEDASEVLPTFPGLGDHYSSPNVLGLAAVIDGPTGWFLTRIEQIKMTTGRVESYARMDVFYNNSDAYAGAEVILEALLDGQVVATDSFTIAGGSRQPAWSELEISGVPFDTLRLAAIGAPGSGEGDGFLGSLDNVEIVPAPGTLVAAALAGLPLARRRR